MNYGSQGDEKTRVRAAVSESDVKRRSSAMKENDEWVTAANARVRETQQGTRTPNKIQERQVKERSGEKEAKRNLLAEFSTPDGYARGKSKPIGAINEEDTVIMTSARKKVSSADVAKRTAEVQKKPIPTPRVQMQNRTVSQPERRIPSASRQIPPRQNTPERRPINNANSEWTSVKKADERKETPARPQNERPPRPISRESLKREISQERRNLNQGRKETQARPEQRKRVFTPIEAEEIILCERMPKRHIISPFTGILILCSVLLSIICIILSVGMSTKIKKIEIKSDDIANINSEILSVCEKYEGKSYHTFEKEKATEEIKAISALVAEVEIKGVYPRKLHVSVIYDTPRYYAQDDIGTTYVTSANLKVLHIYESGETFDTAGLTKLKLPSFTVEKVGQIISFTGIANYVKAVTDALADYSLLGEISYVNFSNTQLIYFIFDGKYRCDLGNSNEIDLKLKAAENTFHNNVLPSLNGDTQRTAIINVSTPSSATYRLDADIGVAE